MSEPKDDSLHFDPADLSPGISSASELPSKLYFRIGEVAKLTGLRQHVLRFWESEFPMVAPKKMGSNHRMYRRKDVEVLLEIKHLLYEKRFTIEGAKKHLESKPKATPRGSKRGSGGVVSSQPMPKLQPNLFGGDDPATTANPAQPPSAGQARQLKKLRGELESILKLLNS